MNYRIAKKILTCVSPLHLNQHKVAEAKKTLSMLKRGILYHTGIFVFNSKSSKQCRPNKWLQLQREFYE